MDELLRDQKERSERVHKALHQRRPRGPRFAILIMIIFAILALVLAFTFAFLWLRTPVMTFSKEASVDHANPGDIIVYTLSYENLGGGDATNVTIRDTLPADVTLVGSDPGYNDVSGKTFIWYIGTVTGGERGNITIIVTVKAGVDNGVNLTNFATFDYKDNNGNPYDQIMDDAETLII